MKESTIKSKLERACKNLFENQPNIFRFTSQTGQTEWNLSHHLAIEIHRLFPRFDCDLDVTKGNYGNKRPDIIIHKRNTDSNLLVIEVKYNKEADVMAQVASRIEEVWFTGNLRYQFGAAINLNLNKTYDVYPLTNRNHPANR